MTVRSRFVLGLFSIAVVLLVPLVYALWQLASLHETTERLQNNEITSSLQMGRIRDAVEELRNIELRLAFSDSPSVYADSMSIAYNKLQALSDSLRDRMPESAGRLATEATSLGSFLAEHQRAALARTPVATARADSIFDNHLRPGINSILRALPVLEADLNATTSRYMEAATSATAAARTAGVIGFFLAVVLATGIAFWLTRSISEPVRDLERAMRTVSDGDFSYALRTERSAPAEFSRLASSYKSMVSQLAELDKLKAEFVSVASHELKTPINVIIGYLQLLDEGVYGDLNPRQREICRVLETQSQSLARLVHQLLDVSRFEAGGGRLETREFILSRFLDELHESFTVLAIQRKIGFRVTRAADLPETVVWDEDRMSEVIGNILSNAFKFTSGGGSVELFVYNAEDAIHFEVRDSGAGIHKEQLPHIFGKFYQADNQTTASHSGTGLGLAIAREIVEAHQGDIRVESEIGVGTTFFLRLPHRAEGGRQMVSRRLTPAHEVGVGA